MAYGPIYQNYILDVDNGRAHTAVGVSVSQWTRMQTCMMAHDANIGLARGDGTDSYGLAHCP